MGSTLAAVHQAQAAIAFALAGEAGSRLAGTLQMPISGDTLRRRIPEDTALIARRANSDRGG